MVTGLICVTTAQRYADVKLVFNDPRFSREAATRPGAPSVSPSTAVPGMLIGLDPPEHTRIRRLVSRAFSSRTIDQKRPRIQQIVDGLLDNLRDHGAPIDALAPAAAGPGAPIEDLLKLLDELDTWLAPYGDRPAAGAFLAWRTPALKESKKVDAAVFDAGRQYLGTAIVSHFAPPDWPAIRRLTRLVLLLELLDPGTTANEVLRSHASDTDLVFDLLRRRTPLFPQGLAVTDIPEPRVQLIRGAKVSDLFVVRSEWSCYQVGEIAAITNVLAHEELARVTTLTDEQEVTTAQTTESFTSEEKVDAKKERRADGTHVERSGRQAFGHEEPRFDTCRDGTPWFPNFYGAASSRRASAPPSRRVRVRPAGSPATLSQGPPRRSRTGCARIACGGP